MASKDYFNDRRVQMRMTSLSALVGLVILGLNSDKSYFLLILGRFFLGIS